VTAALDFNAHIADESARFVDALRTTAADARVPTCPDWDADDLLWHLGKVQAFWATIIREQIVEATRVGQIEAVRPDSRDGLFEYFQQVSADLQAALTDTLDDTTPAWTWSPDHTVGFIRRRQAHEALIHRVDAEVTAGARTPLDPELSADGVEEILRVMYGGHPSWGTFTPDPGSLLRLHMTDAGTSCLIQLGRFTGHDPDQGVDVDETDIGVLDRDAGEEVALITATAADLDCWLWHRPTVDAVVESGDPEILSAFRSVLAFPIN
jgi:uncharacterized protein (TIGR03083 family)